MDLTMTEEWRQALTEESLKALDSQLMMLKKIYVDSVATAHEVFELKKSIIASLSRPLFISDFDRTIFLYSTDLRVSHELAKSLHIPFKKEERHGEIAYVGSKDGIEIVIKGFKHPFCELIPKLVEAKPKIVYEMVCRRKKDDTRE